MEEKKLPFTREDFEAEIEKVRRSIIQLTNQCKNIEALLFVSNYLINVNFPE